MALICCLVDYVAMALYLTPNNSLLREPDISHEPMAPTSIPGHRQSSENPRYHRSLLHFLFVPLGGVLLDSVPLVPCGLSFVPIFLKRFGRRKSNPRWHLLTGRLKALTSISLPSHHGEEQSPV